MLFDENQKYSELWATVLRLAISDENTNPGWIGSKDFYTVCALAGVDGRAVLDRINNMDAPPLLNPQYSRRGERRIDERYLRKREKAREKAREVAAQKRAEMQAMWEKAE